MKKTILSLLVAAFAIIAVQAQEIPERKQGEFKKHEFKRKHHGKKIADLNLSEEQKAQFKALNEAHHKQVAELKKQDNITVKQAREKMEALRKDHQAKVQSLYTAEQKAKIEKSKADHSAKMKAMNDERSVKMKERLNLTDEQSKKMTESRKAMSEKLKAIRENKSLNEEQKREQSKELMKKQKESLKSILTEEQLEKMKEKRKAGKKEK